MVRLEPYAPSRQQHQELHWFSWSISLKVKAAKADKVNVSFIA